MKITQTGLIFSTCYAIIFVGDLLFDQSAFAYDKGGA